MSEISEFVDKLKQQRDELALQMHLGTMEAKQEWEKLEAKWDDFAARAELDTTTEGIGAALNDLGSELKQGYDRIRKAL